MLAMCCHKTRGISENTFQHLFIVHQHIPGRSPHKDLHPTGLRSRKRFQFVKVIVRRAEVKTVVRQRRTRGTLKFLTQRLTGCRGWRNVRHFHKTGNASHYCGSGFSGNGSLMRQTGFAEMNLIINHTGDHPFPSHINNQPFRSGGNKRGNFLDPSLINEDVGLIAHVLTDY